MYTKKDNERWVIEGFEKLTHYPISETLEAFESPDFVFRMNGFRVGLEVTEIYQDILNGNSKLKQQSSFKQKLTAVVISELTKYLPYNFSIDIDLDFTVEVKKSEFDSIAKHIADACTPDLIGLKADYGSIECESYRYDLPTCVKDIRVTRIDALNEPHNSQSEGGAVATLNNSHIDFVVRKKELLLEKFNLCDEYWLIIHEGDYFAGSFGSFPELNTPISSKFDKVFLFRRKQSEVVILK
jgi:hypothetical protein